MLANDADAVEKLNKCIEDGEDLIEAYHLHAQEYNEVWEEVQLQGYDDKGNKKLYDLKY